jgi:predicted enzyme related to lactoylglutathione lyase
MRVIEGGRISYLFILVCNLENMLSFYRDRLGFNVRHIEEGRCAFLELPAADGPQIALYAGRETAAFAAEHWFTVIDVDDLDAAAARAQANKIEVEGIFEVPYGRALKITDPEGNVIQLHQLSERSPD